jgi:hypothetical protein
MQELIVLFRYTHFSSCTVYFFSLSNNIFDDVGTADVPVTAANAQLAVLKTQLIENNEILNRMRKKNRKNE